MNDADEWMEGKGEYAAIPLLGICPKEIIKAVQKT